MASPQVGSRKRFFIMETFEQNEKTKKVTVDKWKGAQYFLNPSILDISTETDQDWEGCLSMQWYKALVERPTNIIVKYFDLDGVRKIQEMNGFKARCFQHEFDHLNGVNMTDKCIRTLAEPDWALWKKRVKELERASSQVGRKKTQRKKFVFLGKTGGQQVG
jgi:peptide deformylase